MNCSNTDHVCPFFGPHVSSPASVYLSLPYIVTSTLLHRIPLSIILLQSLLLTATYYSPCSPTVRDSFYFPGFKMWKYPHIILRALEFPVRFPKTWWLQEFCRPFLRHLPQKREEKKKKKRKKKKEERKEKKERRNKEKEKDIKGRISPFLSIRIYKALHTYQITSSDYFMPHHNSPSYFLNYGLWKRKKLGRKPIID